MFLAFILGMDSFALGLINAARIIEDGRLEEFIRERYSSFETELGKRIRDGKVTLEELAEYCEKEGKPALPGSGRQEYLLSILNQLIIKG